MIKKEKLLGSIESVIEIQKNLVPLLNKHISSSLIASGLKKGDQTAIAETLQKIAVTKTKHIDMLNDIKAEIKKGKNDVY